MIFFGKVKDGKIVLDPAPTGAQLPDGTSVRVEPIERRLGSDPAYSLDDAPVDDDLPPDMAREHDHYFYGTPKRGG